MLKGRIELGLEINFLDIVVLGFNNLILRIKF